MDKESKKIIEDSYDTWRDLNYSLSYKFYPPEVMSIIKNVVASERRKRVNEEEASK